jgi:hypothetical protein
VALAAIRGEKTLIELSQQKLLASRAATTEGVQMSQFRASITPRHSRPSKARTEISAICFISGI